jgi:hypothetical protein
VQAAAREALRKAERIGEAARVPDPRSENIGHATEGAWSQALRSALHQKMTLAVAESATHCHFRN